MRACVFLLELFPAKGEESKAKQGDGQDDPIAFRRAELGRSPTGNTEEGKVSARPLIAAQQPGRAEKSECQETELADGEEGFARVPAPSNRQP